MTALDPLDAALAADILQDLDPVQQAQLEILARRNGNSVEQENTAIVRAFLDAVKLFGLTKNHSCRLLDEVFEVRRQFCFERILGQADLRCCDGAISFDIALLQNCKIIVLGCDLPAPFTHRGQRAMIYVA